MRPVAPFLAACMLATVMTTTLQPDQVLAAETGSSDVEVVRTPGGLEAYLIHAPAVPFLSMAFDFEGGGALDPEGKEGLAYMVSGLLDEGAGDLDSETFRAELEDRSIRLSFDATKDSFTGSLKTLTEERGRAFELLRLAVTQPRFDDEPVGRIRTQILSSLDRQLEDPQYLANESWFATAFKGHPYARTTQGTPASIEAITTDDLRGFVGRRLAQDNLRIGVAGDITAEELAPLLDATFGALPREAAPAAIANTEPTPGGTTVIRRDLPQSVVMFGHGAVARDDPDYYAAYVANYILGGGGFSSRLMEEIREKRGLAYSVYSYLYPLDHASLWIGGTGTENARVSQSLEILRAEVARMAAGDVGQQELDDAKTYLTGSFPLRLTSNDEIARMLVGMQTARLGPNFLKDRNGFIETVTLGDLQRVAARVFSADRLHVVVVGNPPDLEG